MPEAARGEDGRSPQASYVPIVGIDGLSLGGATPTPSTGTNTVTGRSLNVDLQRVIGFLDTYYQSFVVGIPLVSLLVGLIVALVHGYDEFRPGSMIDTVGPATYTTAQTVCASTVAMSLPFACTLFFEIKDGALRQPDKRIDVLGRFLFLASLGTPAYVLLVYIDSAYSQEICALVCFFLSYQGLWLLSATALIITHPDEVFCKPRVMIPLLIVFAASSLVEQFIDMVQRGSEGLVFAYSLLNISTYLLGVVGLLTVLMHCRNFWRGLPVSLRGHDTIYIILVVIIWYVIIRAFGRSDPTADSRYVSFHDWVYFDLLGGTIFLFFSNLRSTNVIMKRIELQEKAKIALDGNNKTLLLANHMLQRERSVALALLHSMVPPRIATTLSNGTEVMPELFAFATVTVCSIAGFTQMAERRSPLEVFTFLEKVSTIVKVCVARFPQLYCVESSVGTFVVVGGVLGLEEDHENDPSQSWDEEAEQSRLADATSQFAFLARDAARSLVSMDDGSSVQLRVGVHCGPVVTGLSGSTTPHYSVVGETMVVAARMEMMGQPSRVLASGLFASLLQRTGSQYYSFEKTEQYSGSSGSRNAGIPTLSGGGSFFVELKAQTNVHEAQLGEVTSLVRRSPQLGYTHSPSGKIVREEGGGDIRFKSFYVPLTETAVHVAVGEVVEANGAE